MGRSPNVTDLDGGMGDGEAQKMCKIRPVVSQLMETLVRKTKMK